MVDYIKWADDTIRKWDGKIKKMGIGVTGDLAASFAKEVVSESGGDVRKIQFMYLLYGEFGDMGVGKGTPLGGAKENSISRALQGKHAGNKRRAKKWYSKTFKSQFLYLADLVAAQYGIDAALQLQINEKMII